MTISLTRDDLVHIAPRPKGAKAAVWDAYVSALMSEEASSLFDRYQINTPRRMQHLLATMVCESSLSIIWESGAYSASRIIDIFGAGHHSSAITVAEARQIASLPVGNDVPGDGPRGDALFERAYGYKTAIGRKMGNTEPGDGGKYRGLGLNQQTGKASQQRAAIKVGCSLEDLQKPINLIHMALIEWQEKNCNKYADNDDAVSIRKLINGGSLKVSIARINGLPQAQAALRLAKNVITDADFTDTAIAEAPEPINENKPVSLMASTEMQAAGIVGTGGAVQMQQTLANAAAQTAAGGRFSLGTFLLHLMSDPIFWITVTTVALAVYMAIKRRKRFHIFGV